MHIFFLIIILSYKTLALNIIEPILLGSFHTTGSSYAVSVVNDIAYVADGLDGLQIIDVTNPSNPTLIFTYDTPGRAQGVIVNNNIAYIADYESGLQIIGVANPSSPILHGKYGPTSPIETFSTTGVTVVSDVAYMTDGIGLLIINVTNPSDPTLIGSYNTFGITDVTVNNDIVYAVHRNAELKIINVTNPSNPTLIGEVAYYSPGDPYGVTVVNDIAYVADYISSGLHIIDVTNPFNPTLISHYVIPGNTSGVMVVNDIAYVVANNNGLIIINVTNPYNTTLVGNYTTPNAMGVTVVEDMIYVVDFYNGLQIIQVKFQLDALGFCYNFSSNFLFLEIDETSAPAYTSIIVMILTVSLTVLFILIKPKLLWWYRVYYNKSYLLFPLFGIANFLSDILFIIHLSQISDIIFIIISSAIFIISILFNYLCILRWWLKKIHHCREQSTTDLIVTYIKNNGTAFYIVMYLSIFINPHILFILRSGLVFSTFHFQFPINERDMSIVNLCLLHAIYSVIPQSVLLYFIASESPFDWSTSLSIVIIFKLSNIIIFLARGGIFIYLGDEIRQIPGYTMKYDVKYKGENSYIPSLISVSDFDSRSTFNDLRVSATLR